MQLPPRLTRVLLVLLGLVGIVIALSFVCLVVVVGSAIAFSGTSGGAWRGFMDSLAPVANFAAGAVALGGVAAIINAAITIHGYSTWVIVAGAIFGGTITLLAPAFASALLSLAKPALVLIGKVFLNK